MQKVFIKGMVCNRCISTVKSQFESIGLQVDDINLGEVTFSAGTQISDHRFIEAQLKPFGFSLLEDKRYKLVSDVKKITEEIYNGDFDFPVRFRFSVYISEKLHKDYDLISATFSALEQITLEKYIIDYRIEKIKEFLLYSTQTLADMAFRLGFSGVAHLSHQFKTVTGFNPSWYRSLKETKENIRNNLR